MKKYVWLLLLATLAASLMAFAACSDDDDEDEDGGGDTSPTPNAEEIAAIEQLVTDLVEGDPTQQADVDFFFERVTDDLLESFFQTTREECMANAEECIGEPGVVESVGSTTVSGGEASTDVTADFGNYTFVLVLDGEVWKVDQLNAVSPEIPAGVAAVNLSLNEFAFGFNRNDIPADGNFAFAATNVGKQNHQIALEKIPADLDVEAALMSEEETEGTEEIAYAGPLFPGDEFNLVFDEPLEPGRYLMVCFFPDTDDPDEKPHALKGMWADFTIEE